MHARTFLLFLTGLLMLAPSAVACRIPWIEPVPPHPHPQVSVRPALQPLVTQRHVAEIEIAEGIANIAISVRFHNPNHQQVEGTYFLPIEADAVVRDFEMIMDGKSLKAELLEADQARRIYEEIVRKMKDPGLLEYVGGRMLRARIFPIAAQGEVDVIVRYQVVPRKDGTLYHLRYSLRSAKPNVGSIESLSFRVTLNDDRPVKLFYSPSHPIDSIRRSNHHVSGGFEQADVVPDRDFDLYWSVEEENVGVAVVTHRSDTHDGFCMISLTPQV